MTDAPDAPNGDRDPDPSGSALDRLVEEEERLEGGVRQARDEAEALVDEARGRARALTEEPEEALADEAEAVRAGVEEELRRARETIRREADRRVEAWSALSPAELAEMGRAVAGEVVRRQGEPLAGRWE